MITDSQLALASSQAISVANNTNVALQNAIDLGSTQGRMISAGHTLYAIITFNVGLAATGLGASQISFILGDAVTGGTVNLSSTYAQIAMLELPAAACTTGKQYVVALSPQIFDTVAGAMWSGKDNNGPIRRYLGGIYKGFSSGTITGTISVDIVLDIQDGRKTYISGFTV